MKKLAIFAGAGVLMLSMASVALGGHHWHGKGSDSDVSINNWAKVTNKVYTVADSGDNDLGGKCVFGGSITTGAASAYSMLGNYVNQNLVSCSDCDGDITIKNGAKLYNKVYTKADSGDNELGGKYVGGGVIKTGAALAGSVLENVVNFNLVGAAME